MSGSYLFPACYSYNSNIHDNNHLQGQTEYAISLMVKIKINKLKLEKRKKINNIKMKMVDKPLKKKIILQFEIDRIIRKFNIRKRYILHEARNEILKLFYV